MPLWLPGQERFLAEGSEFASGLNSVNGRLAWLLEDMGFLLPPFLALEDTLGTARSLMISSLSLFTKHRDP